MALINILSDAELRKQFNDILQPLNKHGHPDTARWQWLNICTLDVFDINGNPLTAEALAKSFSQYISYWNMMYGKKAREGFASKDNPLMDLAQFIKSQSYLKLWQLPQTSRDWYLFGDYTDDELRRQKEEAFKFFENRP